MSVSPDSKQDEFEHDAPQLELVLGGGLLRGKLPPNPVLDGRASLQPVEQPLAYQPIVRALVVGRHRAVVAEYKSRFRQEAVLRVRADACMSL